MHKGQLYLSGMSLELVLTTYLRTVGSCICKEFQDVVLNKSKQSTNNRRIRILSFENFTDLLDADLDPHYCLQ
jgi:hypothetical protein